VSSVDNLKKDAKRWLKAVREGAADARARLQRAYPDAPAAPSLRDIQHAIARERGFENWNALRGALDSHASPDDAMAALLRDAEQGASDPQQWRMAFEHLMAPRPNAVRAGYQWADLIVQAAAKAPGWVIDTLMRHGAAANVQASPSIAPDGARNYIALHHAAYHGNVEAAQALIQFGGDPEHRDDTFKRTAADWADAGGHAALGDRLREAARGILDERRRARTSDDPVSLFLHSACWDHHVHGQGDHRMYDRAAQRLLAQRPEMAHDSIYTAVVCGDIDEVRRLVTASPQAARAAGGPRKWSPLLYLCFTRFTHPPALANAVAIARLLLDHGADPNDFYMAGDSQYTPLVGVAGEGEQDSPRQPWAEEMYKLLLERGAGPYDIQVLYDTHFSTDMIWWLQLTYDWTVSQGRKADWDDPAWTMFDMGGYGPGSSFVLSRAVEKGNIALVEWALAHGAGPNITTSQHPKFRPKRSLLEIAVLHGRTAIADVLRRHGARAAGPAALEPWEAFLEACVRVDRAAVEAIIARHPQLKAAQPVFEAARLNRPDVLAMLADLGYSLDAADAHNTRALHHAAGAGALGAIRFLVERGVEIDPRETSWGATPIGWASHSDRVEAIDLLSRYSRNIWTLVFRGYVDRVREILREQPELARQVTAEGITPLWWLPDEETKAMELVDLLIAAGADPSARNTAGRTAADWARRRGMLDLAARLDARTSVSE